VSATAVTPSPVAPTRERPATTALSRRIPPELAAIYVAAVVGYFLLGLLRHGPSVVPDEFNYAHLASSLAHGDGFSWGGGPFHLRAALYVYLITPSWWLSSGYGAYTIAKLIGAITICTVVVPTYLLARTSLDRRLALIPCCLVAIGTWMIAAGGILTENLALPLATFTVYATVQALRSPGGRWIWIALAAALLATWARYQLIVLAPAIVCALALDVVRSGSTRRATLRAHRLPLAIATVAGGAWAVMFVADPALIGGSYVGIGKYDPSIGAVVSDIWEHGLALVLMVGIVPAIVVLATASRRAAWVDGALGPLLATFVPLAALLLVESSYFTAGYGLRWTIDRYVEYAAPIVFVLFIAACARGPLPRRRVLGVAGAMGIGLWFAPRLWSATEQRSLYGLSSRVHLLLGTGTATSIGILSTAIVLIALAIGHRAGRRALLPLALLTAVVVVVQSEAGWQWQTRLANHWMRQFPADRAWVDDHARGPVARLVVSANSPLAETLGFFNHDLQQVYVPAPPAGYLGNHPIGQTCNWNAPHGTALFTSGCGSPPDRFLIDDPIARVTFYDQHVLARDARLGTLVRVRGAPRLRSVVLLPCPTPYVITDQSGGTVALQRHTPCRGALEGSFWLDRAARLAITFRGGADDHSAALGNRRWLIAAARTTTIQVAVPAGAHEISMDLDWVNSAGAPTVTAARLISPGRTDSLL